MTDVIKITESSITTVYTVVEEKDVIIYVNYIDGDEDSWGILRDFTNGEVEVNRFHPSEYVLSDIWAHLFEGPCMYAGSSIRQAYACKLIEEKAMSVEGDSYNPFYRRATLGAIR